MQCHVVGDACPHLVRVSLTCAGVVPVHVQEFKGTMALPSYAGMFCAWSWGQWRSLCRGSRCRGGLLCVVSGFFGKSGFSARRPCHHLSHKCRVKRCVAILVARLPPRLKPCLYVLHVRWARHDNASPARTGAAAALNGREWPAVVGTEASAARSTQVSALEPASRQHRSVRSVYMDALWAAWPFGASCDRAGALWYRASQPF